MVLPVSQQVDVIWSHLAKGFSVRCCLAQLGLWACLDYVNWGGKTHQPWVAFFPRQRIFDWLREEEAGSEVAYISALDCGYKVMSCFKWLLLHSPTMADYNLEL